MRSFIHSAHCRSSRLLRAQRKGRSISLNDEVFCTGYSSIVISLDGIYPKLQFTQKTLNKDFVTSMENVAWLWRTFHSLRGNEMVCSFQEDGKPFQIVSQQDSTSLAMSFFKYLLVDVQERVYTIMYGFVDPYSPDLYSDGNSTPYSWRKKGSRKELAILNTSSSTVVSGSSITKRTLGVRTMHIG